MINPQDILRQLGLTDSEITVYMALHAGQVQARDIIAYTEEKRPTVYYALSSLERRGLVSKQLRNGEHGYVLESPKRLEVLAREKKKEAVALLSSVQALTPFFRTSGENRETKPSVTFYEGKKAVRNVIMESMYCKSKYVQTIIPEDNFFIALGRSFAETFVKERRRRQISTKNLWTFETDENTFQQYYKGISDVRILPTVMKDSFHTSILLYDNIVLYVSSVKNNYCIKVESEEHASMMNALFMGLWETSTPHT